MCLCHSINPRFVHSMIPSPEEWSIHRHRQPFITQFSEKFYPHRFIASRIGFSFLWIRGTDSQAMCPLKERLFTPFYRPISRPAKDHIIFIVQCCWVSAVTGLCSDSRTRSASTSVISCLVRYFDILLWLSIIQICFSRPTRLNATMRAQVTVTEQ